MFKLSSEASLDGAVTVENKFIVEYMPYADGDYVKVYLYGLSLAARKSDADDTIDRLSHRLNLDRATVDAAVEYWSDLGLMARLGDDITYMSLRTARPKIKKYDVDKYAEFNRQAQLYISARQIAPNEFNEYYSLMEKLDVEWQAMVLIVKYCVDLKGDNVSCPYILAVARNLAQDGYRSYDDVENRLEEYGVCFNELCDVLAVMGGKRPDHESVQLYKKWKMTYRFDKATVMHVAGFIKKGGAAALDARLTVYRDLGLMSIERINAYEQERQLLFKLAKAVNKSLGIYYENVEPEISTFIRPWLDMGFTPEAIISIADYCMKNNLKTLGDLDAVVRDFFATGNTDEGAVTRIVAEETKYDKEIEKIMAAIGAIGAVKRGDRALYVVWREKWALPEDVIAYAASLSAGKTFAYINAILSSWTKAGVTTVDGAKSMGAPEAKAPTGTVTEAISADELNALFTKIGE